MRVLIGTDGSDDAVEAARRALALLGPADAITVVCVVEPPAIEASGLESGFAGGVATPEGIDATWAMVEREAESALERTVAALSTTAVIDQVIAHGAPGPAICATANEVSADVVVVASRGRGAIRRALLGSVSTYVANNAPCPVLVIRAGSGV